jgi:hypothetical protein
MKLKATFRGGLIEFSPELALTQGRPLATGLSDSRFIYFIRSAHALSDFIMYLGINQTMLSLGSAMRSWNGEAGQRRLESDNRVERSVFVRTPLASSLRSRFIS